MKKKKQGTKGAIIKRKIYSQVNQGHAISTINMNKWQRKGAWKTIGLHKRQDQGTQRK